RSPPAVRAAFADAIERLRTSRQRGESSNAPSVASAGMPVSVTVAENSRVAPIHCNSLTNSSPTDSRPSLAARKGSAPSAGGPSLASVLVSFGVVDSPVAVVKVGRRGERVERGSIRGMVLSKVVEDVHDGVTDGARGGERAPMPAIRPKGTAPK